MICVIDNYDSFTFNVVQVLLKNNFEVMVHKNDQISLADIDSKIIRGFLLSPGPGHPSESGVSRDIVDSFHKTHPIFGICLGHQILAQYFGAQVQRAERIMHGKISSIFHKNEGIYRSIPSPFSATRYHSLCVDMESLPKNLEITSWTQNSQNEKYELMGFRHLEFRCEGVQFHPESIMSAEAESLIVDFFSKD